MSRESPKDRSFPQQLYERPYLPKRDVVSLQTPPQSSVPYLLFPPFLSRMGEFPPHDVVPKKVVNIRHDPFSPSSFPAEMQGNAHACPLFFASPSPAPLRLSLRRFFFFPFEELGLLFPILIFLVVPLNYGTASPSTPDPPLLEIMTTIILY